MRVQSAGIVRGDAGFEFSFEGHAVRAHAGETLAAALIAAGHWQLRETRSGAVRGPFCCMGVCGECQVCVNGASRRACLEPATPGCVVTRQPAFAPVRDAPETREPSSNWREIAVDVLIVGAGPAGLSAARAAAAAGLNVLVVDERQKAGGQFFKQPGTGFALEEDRLDSQYREGRRWQAQAQAAGARFLGEASVWGAFAPDAIALVAEGRTQLVRARRLILATGAYECAVAVPGWTLPGVITTGAAQTLLRGSQIAPGERVLVAGNGPLNLQVARELAQAGVDVVAVIEAAPSPFAAPAAALQMALSSPSLLWQGMAHLLGLYAKSVPVHYRHALVSIEGAARVEQAVIARLDQDGHALEGSRRTLSVDAVCVNHGFAPQNELARALGCEFDFDARTLKWSARRADDGSSSVASVYIVGDAGGTWGARCAIAQGALAAARIVRELKPAAEIKEQAARWRRSLRRHQRFQRALWRTFRAAPPALELARPETLICRCEEVTRAMVETNLGNVPRFGVVKRATRAGMGRCQGRYCSILLAALMARRAPASARAEDFFAPRAPCKPVSVQELAGETGLAPEAVDILRTPGRDANIYP